MFLPFLFACDDTEFAAGDPCPPAFSNVDGDCVFDEALVEELVRTFDQGGLEKINAEPFQQIYGTAIQRNVWVTPTWLEDGSATAVELYAAIDPEDLHRPMPAEFPTGTVIVHEAVDREEGHGVRVKREEGWTSEDGHTWWFGKIFDDGTHDENPCSPCTDCHTSEHLPETEGLIGVTREAM